MFISLFLGLAVAIFVALMVISCQLKRIIAQLDELLFIRKK